MVFSSKASIRDEVANESYLLRQGRALDATYGYVCEGFFQDQADIEKHAKQTFGTVRPGDLKYKDINGDGVINSDDQIDLGAGGWSTSPFTFGLNLTLKYKNFTLFAMGSGQTGAVAFKIILITGTEVRASSQKSLWDVGLKKRKEQLLILVFLPAMVIITSVILLSGCTRIMFSV